MKVHNQEENMFTAVALRGLALLPKYVAHFDVSREKSVVAIEKAMKEEQRLFLVAQKDENVEDPKPEDLYTTGVVARIHQVIKVQGGILRLIVESEERAVWTEITDEDGCLNAKIEYVPFEVDVEDETEKEAMFRELHDLFGKYLIVNRNFGKGFVKQMLEIKSLEKLVQFVASNLPLEYKNRQKLLEAKELSTRYQLLLVMLENEISIFKIRAELQSKVRKKVDENQKNYVLREQMQAIREELGEDNFDSEIEDYRSRTKKLKAPKEVKDNLIKKLTDLKDFPQTVQKEVFQEDI